MNTFLLPFISGACFLLGFLIFFHPFGYNKNANRFLGLFSILIGSAFVGSFLLISNMDERFDVVFKISMSLQFLLGPFLYQAVLYFTNPNRKIKGVDFLHLLPFIIYLIWDFGVNTSNKSIAFNSLFPNNEFLVMNILPIICIFYFIRSLILAKNHQKNLKKISSNTEQSDLKWLVQFLYLFILITFNWFNDAFFEIPYVTEGTNIIYLVAIFFLAYFPIRQKPIFNFSENELKEVMQVMNEDIVPVDLPSLNESPTLKQNLEPEAKNIPVSKKKSRITAEEMEVYSKKLSHTMEEEKLYLENNLSLPMVAAKIGLSINDTSYLINETAKDNFYNYVNKHRIEEAKRLLKSSKAEEYNMMGIAYASGFNSKTAFYTTFKKLEGSSPSEFLKKST